MGDDSRELHFNKEKFSIKTEEIEIKKETESYEGMFSEAEAFNSGNASHEFQSLHMKSEMPDISFRDEPLDFNDYEKEITDCDLKCVRSPSLEKSYNTMLGKINWSNCIICQEKTAEDVHCPFQNPLDVYSAFLENVEEFRSLNSLPIDVNFGENQTAQIFLENQALWHKSCHHKFNNAMLEHAKNKKRKGSSTSENMCHPKRQAMPVDKKLCFFCETESSEKIHDFNTSNAETSLKKMATDMGDTYILAKMAAGDLVAMDAKYHLTCLTKYRNEYRSYVRGCEGSSSLSKLKQTKAKGFC